jgi:hypothetical protein
MLGTELLYTQQLMVFHTDDPTHDDEAARKNAQRH